MLHSTLTRNVLPGIKLNADEEMMYRHPEQYGEGVMNDDKGDGSEWGMLDCCGLFCLLDKQFKKTNHSRLVVYFSVNYTFDNKNLIFSVIVILSGSM